MIKVSNIAKNTACQAVATAVDAGTNNPTARIEIRSGTKPVNGPDTEASGILLATHNLSKPAFNNVTGNVANANQIGNATVVAAGTATWWRLYDRDDNAIIDGDVSTIGGTGQIKYSTIQLQVGMRLTLSGLAISVP